MEPSSQPLLNTNTSGSWQHLEPVLQQLSPQELTLFELIAILGEADWSHTLLAAIALHSASEVKRDIAQLVKRGLVDLANAGHYRVSTLIREAASQRFRQWDEYYQRAACAMFATHCLHIAQTYVQEAEREAQVTRHTVFDTVDEFFFQAFRDLIMPEMPHIRQALVWAENYHLWDIFLRFASVAFLERLSASGTNDLKEYPSLQMATLYHPTFTKGELNTPLSSCHIIDGVCADLFVPDAKWIGVRAPRLLLQDVDMVDCQLLACDLSGGLWMRCDAQKATMTDCDLTGTLFKDVKFYKAQFTDVRLAGAVLTRVNLRDAILRGADLQGAVLYDVDLRGTDLRGANMAGIAARRINLHGCLLDDTCWSEAAIDELIADEATRRMIEERMKIPSVAGQVRAADAADELERLQLAEMGQWEDIAKIDVRSANLIGISLPGVDLHDADLRAIKLSQATLTESNLCGAQLQAAQLVSTNLSKADLSKANLRAADLHHAILSSAILGNADASYANLQYGRLDGADLQETNLSHADLFHVDLTDTNLRGAICTGANLRGANVTHAQLLQVARLDEATLPNSQVVARLNGYYADIDVLDGMFLQFAFCDGHFLRIDLIRAEMQGAQFAGAFSQVVLTRADLTDARLSGSFSHCNLKGASLVRAHLSGSFVEVDWREVAFSQADLSGAKLINNDLTGTDVSEAQLRQAHALRGTLLPDGAMYDGRYHLPIDIDTARNLGYNPDDPAEMAAFCSNRKPTFKI